MGDAGERLELTLRLWGTGDDAALESYIEHLESLLPRHRGVFERRAAEVPGGPGQADAVLVFSFPNGAAVDGFLRDPLRHNEESERLAERAVARALITDARHHRTPDEDAADVVEIRGADEAEDS